MSCGFNPFNPSAPKAFDAIVGRGLAAASRWLEKSVGSDEWLRRLDAMDRRFAPERDLPLISFETQWSMLRMALDGHCYPELVEVLEDPEHTGLKNDARLVFEKLAQSQALLVQVVDAHEGEPFYTVKDVYTEEVYTYVDFGDQEPLLVGALMFGRFLIHHSNIYVIPGVFVGTPDVLSQILDNIEEFLDENLEDIPLAMQTALPEIWNICTSIQDERDGVDRDQPSGESGGVMIDPCQVSFVLDVEKGGAVESLRKHPFFSEVDAPEFGYDPLEDTVFEVHVLPSFGPPIQALEGEDEDDEPMEEEPSAIRVGSVVLGADKLTITAMNPVELELLKGLVLQLVACSDS